MSDYRQYVSILSSGSGTFSLGVDTYDAENNVSFIVTATGNAGDDEIDIALGAEAAFNAILTLTSSTVTDGTIISLVYSGVPRLSGEVPYPTFQITRTDHVLCVWSQSRFRIQISENTIGNSIVVADTPVYATLAELVDLAALLGVDLETISGTTLTTVQQTLLLKLISSQIARFTRNNLVASTYLEEIFGRGDQTVFLKYLPIIDYDSPTTASPTISASDISGVNRDYDLNYRTGKLSWKNYSYLFKGNSPFGLNSETKVTYVAGYMTIPYIIKEKLVQLASLSLSGTDTGNIKTLQGGTGRIEYSTKSEETVNYILLQLGEFML